MVDRAALPLPPPPENNGEGGTPPLKRRITSYAGSFGLNLVGQYFNNADAQVGGNTTLPGGGDDSRLQIIGQAGAFNSLAAYQSTAADVDLNANLRGTIAFNGPSNLCISQSSTSGTFPPSAVRREFGLRVTIAPALPANAAIVRSSAAYRNFFTLTNACP